MSYAPILEFCTHQCGIRSQFLKTTNNSACGPNSACVKAIGQDLAHGPSMSISSSRGVEETAWTTQQNDYHAAEVEQDMYI